MIKPPCLSHVMCHVLQKREAEYAAKIEKDKQEAAERAYLARQPRHDELTLEVLLGSKSVDEERAELMVELSNLCTSRHPRAIAEPRDFDDTADKQKKALKEEFSKMKVVSRAKVTQDRIYSMAYHPDTVCVSHFAAFFHAVSPCHRQKISYSLGTSMANLEFGMLVRRLTSLPMMKTRWMLIQRREGSTGSCNYIGPQLPRVRLAASSLTQSMLTVCVNNAVLGLHFFAYTAAGLYIQLRLHDSPPIFHLGDLGRIICHG